MDINSLLSPSDDASPANRPSASPRARPQLTGSNSTSSVNSSGTPVSPYRRSSPRSVAPPESTDVVMREANNGPVDEDVTPLTEDDYSEIEALLENIVQKPYQYSAHIKYIDLLRRAYLSELGDRKSLLLELRKAREGLIDKFPMKESMWLEWIEDEIREARGYEGRLSVMELCGRAVVDQVASTKIWRQYAEFVETQHRDSQSSAQDLEMSEDQAEAFKELFQQEVVVDTYRQGAKATQIDIADSHEIWDRYRDLVVEGLEADPTSPNVDFVYRLYEERLKVPHANITETFSAFSTFVTRYDNANYEKIMVTYNKLYSAALVKWSDREIYEIPLKRQVDAHREPTVDEWNIWSEYLKWETSHPKKKLDTDMAASLYERFLLRFGEVAQVWEDYIYFVLEKANHTPKIVSLLQRATRSCPWSGTLWAHHILALERGFQPFEEVSNVKHKATTTGLLDLGGTEEVLKVNIAWCGFLKRRAFENGASEEEFEVAEMGIAEAKTEISPGGGHGKGKKKRRDTEVKDPHYRIQRIQISFYTQAKMLDAARKVWKELTEDFATSYEFWLRYYQWELANGDRKAAGAVIKHAVNAKNIDWPEKILETWRTHVEDCGNVEEVETMMVKFRKLSNDIMERRQEETLRLQQQQPQEQPNEAVHEAPVQVESPQKTKGKRPRTDEADVEQEAQPAKKSRSEEQQPPPSIPATAIPDQGPPTAAQVAKRDRENSSVIVKNLPPGFPEVKVRQLFRDCGKINSLRIIEEKDGKSSTATVEFDSKEDTLSAQTKDRKSIDGHTIEVQVGTGSTLYVTNFPPIADESYIRNLFKDCGEIIDIRFPSLKYNTHRRFCYVQFSSSEEAQRATQLHGKQLGQKETLVALISAPNQKKDRTGATQEGREIYIRNIDFQAKEQEVRDIFEKFGKIEKIRLPPGPRKGTHKGFGFVIFSSKQEAEAALVASGTTLKSRDLEVSIAQTNPSKLKSGNAVEVARSMSPEHAANGAPSPATADDAASPAPSFDTIKKKTLGVMNLPDTVNDIRITELFSAFGPLRKVVLRPDHQGAIVEYENVADAGKAALKMEGHEIDGRKIEIGEHADLMKRKPEKKITRGNFESSRKPLPTQSQMVPSSVLRGAGGRKRGLGFAGALSKKTRDGEDVEMRDSVAAKDERKGKSNDDFKKMFLKTAD